jgi:hypothetical protein
LTVSAREAALFKRLHLGTIVLLSGVVIVGSTVAAAAAPANRGGQRHHGGSVVTSVNGVSTAGTCGVAGAAGNFTIVGKHLHVVTVDVATSTTFTDSSDPAPSFADVCVGNYVKALGTFSSGTLTTTSVAVLPPNTGRIQGVVTSVNGVPTAGTCGASATTGDFTVVGRHLHIITVEVATTTSFTDTADPSPSFLDVCVGADVKALGMFSSGTFTASSVEVIPPRTDHVKAVVTSVNGVSTSGTCGSSGATGAFTLVPRRHAVILTVNVTSTTTFIDSADPSASFADICVGDKIEALGTLSTSVLTAAQLVVLPPSQHGIEGMVTSVNGVSTTGTCGVSGSAGAFTLVPRHHSIIVTVEVTSTTTFTDSADPSPSFLDICVGTDVGALGTFSAGTLTAAEAAVVPAWPGGHGGHHHHAHH